MAESHATPTCHADRSGDDAPDEHTSALLFVYALAGLAVLGVAVWLFARPYLAPEPDGAEPDRVVRISMTGWDPAVIEAKAGEPLTIQLVNGDTPYHADGGGWHNFVVESLDIEERVGPKATHTFTLPALEPGTYAFYCDACCGGKDNAFMQGKLVVS